MIDNNWSLTKLAPTPARTAQRCPASSSFPRLKPKLYLTLIESSKLDIYATNSWTDDVVIHLILVKIHSIMKKWTSHRNEVYEI